MTQEKINFTQIDNYLKRWKEKHLNSLNEIHKEVSQKTKMEINLKEKNITYNKNKTKEGHPQEISQQSKILGKTINRTNETGKISATYHAKHTADQSDKTKKSLKAHAGIEGGVPVVKASGTVEGEWSHEKGRNTGVEYTDELNREMTFAANAAYEQKIIDRWMKQNIKLSEVELKGMLTISFNEEIGDYDAEKDSFSGTEKKRMHEIPVAHIFNSLERLENVIPIWKIESVYNPKKAKKELVVKFTQALSAQVEWLEEGNARERINVVDEFRVVPSESKPYQTNILSKKESHFRGALTTTENLAEGFILTSTTDHKLDENAKVKIGNTTTAHLYVDDDRVLTPEEYQMRHREIMKALDQVKKVVASNKIRIGKGAVYTRGDTITASVVNKQSKVIAMKSKYSKFVKSDKDNTEVQSFIEKLKNKIIGACSSEILFNNYPDLNQVREEFLIELDNFKIDLSDEEKRDLKEIANGISKELAACSLKISEDKRYISDISENISEMPIISSPKKIEVETNPATNLTALYGIKPLTKIEQNLKEEIKTFLDNQYPEDYDEGKEYRQYILGLLNQFNNRTPFSDRSSLISELTKSRDELRESYDQNILKLQSKNIVKPIT
jgi:hypothetical protein